MMSIGIICVHGYTGSPKDIQLLVELFAREYDADSVTNCLLPGHDALEFPQFDKDLFVESISAAVESHKTRNKKIILIGHSTGGNLMLLYCARFSFVPHLLILTSTPKRIDGAYLNRWEKYAAGVKGLPLTSVAKMVTAIHESGAIKFSQEFSVLILHGEKDELVPVEEAFLWGKNSFTSPPRIVVVSRANHDILAGPRSDYAHALIRRSVADISMHDSEKSMGRIKSVLDSEKALGRFLEASPNSCRHLEQCPSTKRVLAESIDFPLHSDFEPVFANIEITTQCNLRCKYCARALIKKQGKNMSINTFRNILSILPHAYRITFVGLGEPLLNPHITDFISEATLQKRHVGLVTNATCMTEDISSDLLRSGLNAITFSIDTADQAVIEVLRSGSDIRRVIENIGNFADMAKFHQDLSTAVFCTLSVENVSLLEQAIKVISRLGVRALMLTDLNFQHNIPYTLWKNQSRDLVTMVSKAISRSFSLQLPVLSVHALEEFGLSQRYRNFLLIHPTSLFTRMGRHIHCMSPWQTIPIDVDGNAYVCDCQPQRAIGNLLEKPLDEIWNSQIMMEHRMQMRSDDPPFECSICPRF
jgi:radical SAM protein with 4Fe4S-binding SPASM domain